MATSNNDETVASGGVATDSIVDSFDDPMVIEEARARPRVVKPLARALLAVFFRSIEVTGAERVPATGPIVFAANHINGLVDPALLMLAAPRAPRFLAKSTLWSNIVVRPFLRLAAAIPVYRRSDPGVDSAKNQETFSRCHAVLAAGGAIALFPEGRSHNEPAIVPLKTGISRIVLEAEERFGGLGTRIVPVGLTFEDKGRFRSRVLVSFGDSVDPAPECEVYERDPRGAVRALTERVREALAHVTLNFPSWQEARLIERAAELYARPESDLPAEPTLAERFAVHKAFIAGYRTLQARAPERVRTVAAAVEAYDDLLSHYRLRDRQVASRYPRLDVLRFLAKSLGLLLVRLPLAVLGTLTNAVPYLAVDVASRRMGKTPDVVATYKLFGSLLFYPAVWMSWAVIAGHFFGWPSALASLALVPVAGAVALRFWERRRFFVREARAYLLLRSAGQATAVLKNRRQAVLESVRALAAELGL